MISAATRNQILETARIEDVVGDVVTLKRRGANLIGLCPFHNERTPSFTVSPTKGIFKCFGCGKSGNVVNFVMELESLSYPEALKQLAARYNIEVEEFKKDNAQILSDQLAQSLSVINNFAQDYYHKQLFETDEGKSIGLAYFKERGLKENTIKQFGLGFAGEVWDQFYKAAVEHGFKTELLTQSSLIVVKENSAPRDFLRNRIVFPLYNLTGKVVGFAGRLMTNQKDAPKYLNSAETELYQKSKLLYGLNLCREGIRKRNECLIVEGYMDVITMYQSGLDYAVASAGTSLTPEQVRSIKRFTTNLTFLYDGDEAGLKAALRGLEIALKEGMNVQVCVIPDADDPDSYLRKHGAAAMTSLLAETSPHRKNFIKFQVDLLLKDAGNDPVKRADVVNKILPSLSLLNDPIRVALLARELAVQMQLDEQTLLRLLNKIKAKNLQKDTGISESDAKILKEHISNEVAPRLSKGGNAENELEKKIVELLVKYGALDYDGDDTVATHILKTFEQIDLVNPTYNSILSRFKTDLRLGKIPTYHELLEFEDSAVVNAVTNFVSSNYEISPKWADQYDIYTTSPEERYRKEVNVILTRFTLHWIVNKLMHENGSEMQEATKNGDIEKERECLTVHIGLNKWKMELAAPLGITYLPH